MAWRKLYVLIACEESQAECKAFRELGHIAYSCDIQSCQRKGNKDWHIKGDVTPFLIGVTSFVTESGLHVDVPRWDLIVAHPPCTYLCKVGSPHLYKDPDTFVFLGDRVRYVNGKRLRLMENARKFFFRCLYANAHYVAVENPCPMKIAELPKPNAFACPSWYSCKYTKKTYYWLKNLPPLMAEDINTKTRCLVNSSRGKYRSRTYIGLAKAIAKQWSEYIMNDFSIY